MFLFFVSIVLYNLLNALAVSDTQEIKRDAKLIDLTQRIMTMYDSEKSIFKRNSRIGNWLKMVISMFPKTIPGKYIVIKIQRSLRVFISEDETILLNKWFPRCLNFLKKAAKLNPEIVNEILIILKKRSEDQKIAELRKLKESRIEKLANDMEDVNEFMSTMQKNFIKMQNELTSMKLRTN